MDEIVPGILHWSTFHEGIGQAVHSHVHTPSGAIFDPRLPDEAAGGGLTGPESGGSDGGEGLLSEGWSIDALAESVLPSVVLLSSRHHRRDAEAIATEFEIPIKVSAPGAGDFADAGSPDVETFAFGTEVIPGVDAIELPALAPDETVFRLSGTEGRPAALLFGDSLIHPAGELTFVPDSLMGDDPAAVKAGLLVGLRSLLDDPEPFDTLLFAHGSPIATGGREALEAFVAAQGG